MELTKKQITAFQEKILTWYVEHQRDLPWRKSRDPYRILVSEIMLQQTQVSRVIPKYDAWFVAFPMIERLAEAPVSEVLRHWSGLGYNRRALFLQKTAQAIVREHNGVWPQSVDGLKSLPGIGPYTSGAVACFAFNQQVAVVDTNIRKVILLSFFCHCEERYRKVTKQSLTHRTDCRATLAMTQKEIQQIADMLLPHGKAYAWNQALMDYAAAVLVKEKVPVVKQSKFIGSNRYYRGKTLKVLLEHHALEEEQLGKLLKADYSRKDKKWLEKILSGLVKEGFVMRNNGRILLPKN